MKDITAYTLIYFCRTTSKEFRGKTLADRRIALVDPETGEEKEFTSWHLFKEYRSHKDNRMKNRPVFSKPKTNIRHTGTKAWKDYMSGSDKYCTNY